ncbi:putative hydro-lyase [Candidatus Bipolaricaulota bacterium]
MKRHRVQQPDQLSGIEARALIRTGEWSAPTAGMASGYVQANLVVVPSSIAEEFERFCRLNPKPLPLLERTEPGSYTPQRCAKGADLRTDIPKYRVYGDGVITREVTDLLAEWQDDWCAFLLGCSFTFDSWLAEAGIPARHLEQNCNVPMYETNRALRSCEPFSGYLVVSMRPIPIRHIDRVVQMTRPLKLAHGEPVHIGSPQDLGIADLSLPDHGDAVQIHDDEVPVFWACGVTAQQVAVSSRIPLMVSHAPGHMFITDWLISDLIDAEA